MIGSCIAFNPCCKCDEKSMCNICELIYRRNGQLADSADIAKEIFAEIETSLMVSGCRDGSFFYEIRVEDYNHYKKKYTESEAAERREDIENSPEDCSTPSVTGTKGERNEQR